MQTTTGTTARAAEASSSSTASRPKTTAQQREREHGRDRELLGRPSPAQRAAQQPAGGQSESGAVADPDQQFQERAA
ncbi:hypothetical protein, partial [Streptomyces sp. NRRL F-5135]|uniref:hypothetical protein n=1 Tax=Streptomyces sp. NRRL F-5135 TaxID=1463858 RepID=UPI0004C6DE7E